MRKEREFLWVLDGDDGQIALPVLGDGQLPVPREPLEQRREPRAPELEHAALLADRVLELREDGDQQAHRGGRRLGHVGDDAALHLDDQPVLRVAHGAHRLDGAPQDHERLVVRVLVEREVVRLGVQPVEQKVPQEAQLRGGVGPRGGGERPAADEQQQVGVDGAVGEVLQRDREQVHPVLQDLHLLQGGARRVEALDERARVGQRAGAQELLLRQWVGWNRG